jgi:SeqA protein N-terminal domain
MKTIQVDRSIYDYLVSKASPPGEAISSTLRRELQVPEPEETIEIDDDSYAFLLSKATTIGESPSDILRRELHLDEPPPPDQPGLVIFHIPAGTGTQPWNTAATAVQAKVGDTLRIVNDDSAPHRPHTEGPPFPHPSTDIPPGGGSADFLLQQEFQGALYDHDSGQDAKFWITVQQAP